MIASPADKGAAPKPPEGSPKAPLTPEDVLSAVDARAYRRFVEWSVDHGFALAIVSIVEPYRREALAAWTAATFEGTRVLRLDDPERWAVGPLLIKEAPPEETRVLVLRRLEEAKDRVAVCKSLNIPRDDLAKRWAVPWVILVHPSARIDLEMHAPDFVDFAGLWILEDAPQEMASPRLELVSDTGRSPMSLEVTEGEATDLLLEAFNAAVLGHPDEARDKLALFDLRHPDAKMAHPGRLRVLAELAYREGRIDEALLLLQENFAGAERLGDRGSRAVTLDNIARIRALKGEVDEALRLYQESLVLFEELGKKRPRAITLSNIARILAHKGEVDEALRLHQESLVVFEELGDRHSRAITLGDIARILAHKGEVDEALRLLQESLTVFEELGDKRSRAITLGDIARIRRSKGEVDEALRLLQESLTVFEELGDRHSRAATLTDIADILSLEGEVDEALRLHQECLSVFEELGNADAIANSQWLLGKLALQRGRTDDARQRFEAAYQLLLKIERLDGICIVGLDLAPLLLTIGRLDEAKEILVRSRDGFLRLGLAAHAKRANELLAAAEAQEKA